MTDLIERKDTIMNDDELMFSRYQCYNNESIQPVHILRINLPDFQYTSSLQQIRVDLVCHFLLPHLRLSRLRLFLLAESLELPAVVFLGWLQHPPLLSS